MNPALELLPTKARRAASRQWREDMGCSFNVTERLCRAIRAANEAMGLPTRVCEMCCGEGEIEMQPSTNPRPCPDCGGTRLSPENSSEEVADCDDLCTCGHERFHHDDGREMGVETNCKSPGCTCQKFEAENSSGVEEGRRFPTFELVAQSVYAKQDEHFELCGNCGGIANAGLWQGLNRDEETDQLVGYDGPNEPHFWRCPLCGFDHTDDDGDPGVWAGAVADMLHQRRRLLAEDDFDWKTLWEEAAASTQPDPTTRLSEGTGDELRHWFEVGEKVRLTEAYDRLPDFGRTGRVLDSDIIENKRWYEIEWLENGRPLRPTRHYTGNQLQPATTQKPQDEEEQPCASCGFREGHAGDCPSLLFPDDHDAPQDEEER